MIGSLIEATAYKPPFMGLNGKYRVVIDAETGETISTNVPVGSAIWRRMVGIARGHVG
jgi:hypothetical protein